MTHSNANEGRLTATQDWKGRMATAKKLKPENVGMQLIIEKIVEYDPSINCLTYANRWHNAWNCRIADPELTILVEKAVAFYQTKAQNTTKRLARMKLKKVQ